MEEDWDSEAIVDSPSLFFKDESEEEGEDYHPSAYCESSTYSESSAYSTPQTSPDCILYQASCSPSPTSSHYHSSPSSPYASCAVSPQLNIISSDVTKFKTPTQQPISFTLTPSPPFSLPSSPSSPSSTFPPSPPSSSASPLDLNDSNERESERNNVRLKQIIDNLYLELFNQWHLYFFYNSTELYALEQLATNQDNLNRIVTNNMSSCSHLQQSSVECINLSSSTDSSPEASTSPFPCSPAPYSPSFPSSPSNPSTTFLPSNYPSPSSPCPTSSTEMRKEKSKRTSSPMPQLATNDNGNEDKTKNTRKKRTRSSVFVVDCDMLAKKHKIKYQEKRKR